MQVILTFSKLKSPNGIGGRKMGTELLTVGIEELLNRTAEILKNQQIIMKNLNIKKEDQLSSVYLLMNSKALSAS